MTYSTHARNGLIFARTIGPYIEDGRVRRDLEAGRLVRLRRGTYVDGLQWNAASPRERHLLRVRAVQHAARTPIVAAGASAAALWGMPLTGYWPDEVTVLDRWRGGGRSEPGVRRTAVGQQTARVVEIDGIMCTDLARTTLDIARGAAFVDAVASVDWALWRRNPACIALADLVEELQRLNPRFHRAHLERVIGFATPLSDSFGESAARATMHLLGFAAPELQVVLRDAQGVIRPDFLWRRANIAGEFDGKQKYTRDAYTKGNPSEVVWQEKKREDRLRRMSLKVTRFLTSDVAEPRRLEQLLLEAGVPRAGAA